MNDFYSFIDYLTDLLGVEPIIKKNIRKLVSW